MKAYLKPEDEQELLRMVKSLDLVLALRDMDEWLKSAIKYGEKEYLQEVRDALHRTISSHNINLDDLIS